MINVRFHVKPNVLVMGGRRADPALTELQPRREEVGRAGGAS